MNREKKLVKNTLIISIGKICTQLITFLLLPLYTALLTTEEYGIVDLLNTLVYLLVPIITFQVEKAVFRELLEVRKDQKKINEIITNGIISVCLQCVVFGVLFIVISPLLNNKYKYYLIINVIASIFNSLLLQIARGVDENGKYAFASFFSVFTTIIFNILFMVILEMGLNGMLLGTLLGQIFSAIYLFISLKIYKKINFRVFSKQVVKKLWKYSLPLIPNAISWWIYNASDRIIVSTFLGLSYTGVLSAASKFSSIYISLYNIFDISWTESISLQINDLDIKEYFNKMINIILRIFIAIALGIIACMPIVYPILINEKFNFGYKLVPILVVASLFNVIIGLVSVIYVANKKTKDIANTSTLSAIINIITHLALIKFLGLYAAAISTFISIFVMTCYRIYDINRKYMTINIEKKLVIESIIAFIIVIIIYYYNQMVISILGIIFAFLFAVYFNKGIIINFLNIIKSKKIFMR